MSVYVDQCIYTFGRMKMCHMVADSSEELRAMAKTIGVDEQWVQKEGTYREHFDICKSKRALAIAAGAQSVTPIELGRILRDRRLTTNASKER